MSRKNSCFPAHLELLHQYFLTVDYVKPILKASNICVRLISRPSVPYTSHFPSEGLLELIFPIPDSAPSIKKYCCPVNMCKGL